MSFGKYSTSTCEHGDEPPNSIKCREFIDYLKDCQLVSVVILTRAVRGAE
jgi:hypothetical protein